jgi:hypothetical protein
MTASPTPNRTEYRGSVGRARNGDGSRGRFGPYVWAAHGRERGLEVLRRSPLDVVSNLRDFLPPFGHDETDDAGDDDPTPTTPTRRTTRQRRDGISPAFSTRGPRPLPPPVADCVRFRHGINATGRRVNSPYLFHVARRPVRRGVSKGEEDGPVGGPPQTAIRPFGGWPARRAYKGRAWRAGVKL